MSTQTRNMLAQQPTNSFGSKAHQDENSRFTAKAKTQQSNNTRRAGVALTDKTNIIPQVTMQTKPAMGQTKQGLKSLTVANQPATKNAGHGMMVQQTVEIDQEGVMSVDAVLNPTTLKPQVVPFFPSSGDSMEMDLPHSHEDIDLNDHNDPQAVTAYVDEVYENCRQKEIKYTVTHNYMSTQKEINERMRYILIDWMVEVHLKFKLLPETMSLAVNLIDRFLSKHSIPRDCLQLVGITCMFIASKYEEIYPPECNDFVYISASAYSRDQILEMESTILNALEFNLTVPTSLHFLRRFSKAARSDYPTHILCKYFLEIAMLDMRMIQYYPSMIAAASVYLARVMNFATADWNPTLVHYTKYDSSEVASCAADLLASLQYATNGASQQAVIRKYASRKFAEVAKRVLPDAL